MRLLHGPRIIEESRSPYGVLLRTSPIHLNIDRFNEIRAEVRAALPGCTEKLAMRDAGGVLNHLIDDPLDISPVETRELRVVSILDESIEDESTLESQLAHADISVEFWPSGAWLSMNMTPNHRYEDQLRTAAYRIERILVTADAGSVPGTRIVSAGLTAIAAVLLACWAWLALTWHNIPGLALLAVATVTSLLHLLRYRQPLAGRIDGSRRRRWLNRKSQSELDDERANRHRDLIVAVWSAALSILATVIVFLLIGR